jgi:flavin reductase (DIM6/NTAB) family NADH-FMN oxidoreductase RutF
MTLIDKNEFRSALSEFATGVTVITTLDNEGEPHTMTANAFTSVCLEPPVILVCIAHGTHTFGYVESRQAFGVNFLNQDQQELGAYFAKKPEDRTGDVEYNFSKSNEGLPVLDDSIVFFECAVVGSHVYGDHTIFLAEVKEIRRNESDSPLMFYKSRWYKPAKD